MSALVIANWKMNGTLPAIEEFAEGWRSLDQEALATVTTVICPPFPYLGAFRQALPDMALGGQDCSHQSPGAYTGDVAAEMLVELDCRWVILGHSERREYHGETDVLVAAKACRAIESGLTAIVCVGEKLEQRDAGEHESVVADQLAGSLEGVAADALVIAYEPVWAIGTGRSATPEQAESMHRWIRQCLIERYGKEAEQIAIVYGGSVKPETAGELFTCETIDGALVGGASLKAESFWGIAEAAGASGRN